MKFQGIYRAFMVPVHHTGMRSPFLRRSSAGSPFRVSLLTGLLIATGTPAFAPAQVNAPERTPSPLFSKALPDLGDETDLSIAAERRLGDSIVRSLYRDPDYLDDPILTDYVQSIWQPLLRSARARGDLRPDMDEVFAWEILISKERDVNAFALPGGYFGLYLGLVGMVNTRDELASVLGHEISHVTQRHIARRMSKESAQTPWIIGGMILGLLAASKSNNYNAANATIMGSQAIAIQNSLNYSRDMEREADRTGFGLTTEAGFEAQGFVAMFEKLQQAGRNNDSGGFPYLRSHPLTTERIADMQGRIGMQAAAPLPADADWQALLMAARARVLSNSGVDALRLWQADVQPKALASKTPAQQSAALYGAALAAIRMRSLEPAKALVDRLAAVAGAPPLVERIARLLRADIALATEDLAGAANAMAAQVRPALPNEVVLDRAELLLRAQLHTDSGQAEQAARDLYRWVLAHPRDFNAWRSLGRAYEVQGRSIAAIRALAQADGLQHDWSAALARLRAAQDLVRKGQWGSQGPDYIEATIVDTRAREIVQMMREQAAQQR